VETPRDPESQPVGMPHHCYVAGIEGGQGGYVAVCTLCSWRGPTRQIPPDAEMDCQMHEGEHSA
jgi:hypothetical protein